MGEVDKKYTKPIGGTVEWARKGETQNVWADQKFVGHTVAEDLKLIGLDALPADEEALTAAFRERVKAVAGQEGVDMDAVKQARDRLRETLARGVKSVNPPAGNTCKICNGKGRVGNGFGTQCPSCKGTGHT